MKEFRGIIPPLVTPVTADGIIDFRGLQNLIDHEIDGGVNGLFISGTTGEGPSLTDAALSDLIRAACEMADRKLPVLVGISSSSYGNLISRANASEKSGASAVVIAPPFYFPMSQSELYHYYVKVLDELPVAAFLYNIPSSTKVSLGTDLLKDLIPNKKIIGVKDSSGDFLYFQKVKQITDKYKLPVFMGPEELLFPALAIGAAGGVSGGANMFPKLFVQLFETASANEWDKCRKLHKLVLDISENIYSDGAYGGSHIINGIKSVLSVLGICDSHMMLPLQNISKDRKEEIEQFVVRFKSRLNEIL